MENDALALGAALKRAAEAIETIVFEGRAIELMEPSQFGRRNMGLVREVIDLCLGGRVTIS